MPRRRRGADCVRSAVGIGGEGAGWHDGLEGGLHKGLPIPQHRGEAFVAVPEGTWVIGRREAL